MRIEKLLQVVNLGKRGLPFVVVSAVAIVGAGIILPLPVNAQIGDVVVAVGPVHVVNEFGAGQWAPKVLCHDEAVFGQPVATAIHGVEQPVVGGVNARAGQANVSLGIGASERGIAVLAVLHPAAALAVAGEAAEPQLMADGSREHVPPGLACWTYNPNVDHAMLARFLDDEVVPVNRGVGDFGADSIAARLPDQAILVASTGECTLADAILDHSRRLRSNISADGAPNIHRGFDSWGLAERAPVNVRMRGVDGWRV